MDPSMVDSRRRALRASPARMPLARPRREEQEQPGVARRSDLAPLVRLEVCERPRAARRGLSALLDLDLSVDHYQPCAFMDLVLLELLSTRQVDRDDSRFVVRAKNFRAVRLDRQRSDVPGVHGRTMPQSRAPALARPAVPSTR